MKTDDRDQLDRMIDAALPGYSSAEPLEGLEARVLQRLSGAAPRVRWPYRLGLALAASLAACVIVWMNWSPRARVAPPARRQVAVVKPPAPAPAPLRQRVRPKRRVVKSLPKEEVFPSPAPLTPEERALATWAARAPLEAQQVFADLRKRSEEPITIPAIEIPPLNGGTE